MADGWVCGSQGRGSLYLASSMRSVTCRHPDLGTQGGRTQMCPVIGSYVGPGVTPNRKKGKLSISEKEKKKYHEFNI